MVEPYRILVSNDDGIFAPGIQALAAALEAVGEVWVVAPDREQSAQSHALTLARPLRIRAVAPRRFAVDGTPTDSVFLGINQVLKGKVDLVVSGINHGANLGEDVIYSGTVAAAREASLLGFPAFAMSVVGNGEHELRAAAGLAPALARRVLKEASTRRLLLNVNVPNRPPEAVRGVRWTRLGSRTYGAQVVEMIDPRGRPCYWIGGATPQYTDEDGTDCNAVLDGYISITPLSMDLTDHRTLAQLDVADLAWEPPPRGTGG